MFLNVTNIRQNQWVTNFKTSSAKNKNKNKNISNIPFKKKNNKKTSSAT